SLLLNLLWIVFGGLWMALAWVIAAVVMAITIVGLPGQKPPSDAPAATDRLPPCKARHGRQRGSARGQMQKSSAGKFHFEPPSRFTSLDRLVGAAEQSGWKAERLPGRAFVARQAALEDLTLDHLTYDRLHVCLRKRSQRLRANISKGATAQSKRGDRNVIWCLNNRDHVVLAQCPEGIPHGRSALLRHFFEGVCPFW